MALNNVDLGTAPDNGTGDDIRTGGGKINANFAYLDGVKLEKSTYTGNAQDLEDAILAGDIQTLADAKVYTDTLAQGIKWKQSVTVATTANIALTGEQTIDGVLTSGNRVLVKDQTNATENGIYISNSGAWTRSLDADTGTELVSATVTIEKGTANKDKNFNCSSDSIVLGTDPIVFNTIANTVSHNSVTGLQGGQSNEYYHLTLAERDSLPKKTAIVNNITDLKAFTALGADSAVEVLGYYAKGDGGGGSFYWDATSTETDNGGTIIKVTSVTTGRWKRRFSGAVNVKWFGAKGDGVTDDSLAIQNTIDYSNGLEAEFPSGIFLISTPLNITYDGFKLTGSGVESSILKINSAINAIQINDTMAGYVLLLEFYGFTIDGNNFGLIGIDAHSAANIDLRNIQIKGFNTAGVKFDDVTKGQFNGCRFTDNAGDGVVLGRQNDAFIFTSCDFIRSGGYGLVFGKITTGIAGPANRANGCTITGCAFILNGLGGALITGENSNGVSFIGCYYERNTTSHIQLGTSDLVGTAEQILITGCNFHAGGVTNYGVLAYKVQRLIVQLNWFEGSILLDVKMNNQCQSIIENNHLLANVELYDGSVLTTGNGNVETGNSSYDLKQFKDKVLKLSGFGSLASPSETLRNTIAVKQFGLFNNKCDEPTMVLKNPADTYEQVILRTHYMSETSASISGTSDYILSTSQYQSPIINAKNATGDASVILPNNRGRTYTVLNSTNFKVTFKKSGGTGVVVEPLGICSVWHNGTDYQRLDTGTISQAEKDGWVNKTGAQSISGVKTFDASPLVPTPTADAHAATKKYVDDKVIANRPVKNIAGNIYTLALEDKTKWLRFTHTGGLVTVTVPDAVFALDDELMGDSSGQDVVFVNGAGFTLKYPISKKAEIPKEGVFGMRFRAVNSAVIFGSLKPI